MIGGMVAPAPSPPATRWWRGRALWRLLLVRVLGQAGDGATQAALASYALFGDRRADPLELAAAAAVVLLPYSLLGPFVGVLLDRWSRRQVLLVGNLTRTVVVLGVAVLVGTDAPEVAVYATVLVALGVNRFLLAGLSAALPHTVPVEDLTPANALTPTVGTAAFVLGLGAGGVLRALLDDGRSGAAADGLVVAAGAAAYVLAAAAALLTGRADLGPDHRLTPPSPRHVAAGLVASVHHLRQRSVACGALLTASVVRWGFGLLAVTAVLALRNDTVRGDTDAALAAVGGFTAASAAGFLLAAALTPWLVHRRGRPRVVRLAVLVAAVVLLGAWALDGEAAWAVLGLVGGLAAQGVKVCADALVQEHVDDDFRGRVFAVYDLAFNLAVVSATVLVAVGADDRGVPGGWPLAVGVAGLAAATRLLRV